MQRWSQTLIDGAGNFGWTPGPFETTDIANAEMDKCIRANAERVRAEPDSSALSVMVNAKNPIPESQMIANVKIAIGRVAAKHDYSDCEFKTSCSARARNWAARLAVALSTRFCLSRRAGMSSK